MANEADAPAKLVEVPNENAGGRYVNKFGYGNESASSLPLLSRPLSEDFAGAAADPQITPTSGPAQKRKSRSKHVLKLVLITLVVFVGITFAVVLLDRKD